MSMFADFRNAAKKRAEYNRTLTALSQMSRTTAADLGLEGQNLRDVAHRAVYGN